MQLPRLVCSVGKVFFNCASVQGRISRKHYGFNVEVQQLGAVNTGAQVQRWSFGAKLTGYMRSRSVRFAFPRRSRHSI